MAKREHRKEVQKKHPEALGWNVKESGQQHIKHMVARTGQTEHLFSDVFPVQGYSYRLVWTGRPAPAVERYKCQKRDVWQSWWYGVFP